MQQVGGLFKNMKYKVSSFFFPLDDLDLTAIRLAHFPSW